jgi:hypothetical protein
MFHVVPPHLIWICDHAVVVDDDKQMTPFRAIGANIGSNFFLDRTRSVA